jgi:outer membrane protein assembly factor BamB
LEFNYGSAQEEISLIDLNSGKVVWKNADLFWSIEQYGNLANELADLSMKKTTSKAATGLAAGALFPVRHIQDIVSILPGQNKMFIKTFEGLTCLEISSGKVIWNVTDLKGEVAYIHYDENSNSILTFGGNPIWMPAFLNRIQVNKKLFKIDAASGEVLWNTNYSRNFMVKNDGGFQNELEKKPDVRIVDGKIILNFLQLEVIDFETGASVFETSTGRDAMMNVVPEANPATLFSFPCVEDGVLYRAVINRVLAFNQSLVVEAYNLESGELIWVSEELTRKSINNISQIGDYIAVGTDGSEGIVFLDKKTGKQNASLTLSKSGVTKKWIVDNGKIIVPEKNIVHIVQPENATIKHSVNVSSAVGTVHKLILNEKDLYVLGSKKGIGKYNLDNGNLIASVKTGFSPEVINHFDKSLITSQNPSDAILILANSDLSVRGSLKKSKKRTALGWNGNLSEVYEVKNDRLEKFSTLNI